MRALKALAVKLARRTVVRYLFVGGTAYSIELSSLLFIFYLSGSRTLATAIAFWIGFFVAFVLQKLVAFQEYSRQSRAIARQGALYVGLSVWNYIFTVAFVSIFPDKYLIISRTVALALMSCWNYAIYKKIIFKRDAGL